MKLRKLFLVLVLGIAAVLAMSGCRTEDPEPAQVAPEQTQAPQQDAPAATPEPVAERPDLHYEIMFIISQDRIPDRPCLIEAKLIEDFGIIPTWIDTPETGLDERITLLFASGMAPDVVWPMGVNTQNPAIRRLMTDGFLYPVSNHFDRMPNFRALWTDEEYAMLYEFAATATGNIYFVPARGFRTAGMTWIYRRSAFEEMGLEFPETLDDLWNVFTVIKEHHPDSVPMANRGIWGVLQGIAHAHLIPTGQSGTMSYIHPRTGEFVGSAATSQEMRDTFIFGYDMFSYGFIDREFATMNDQLWTQRHANGLTFIEYSFAERADWASMQARDVDPDVEWAWTTNSITAQPDGAFTFDFENPSGGGSGVLFNVDLDQERLFRMLEFFDWTTTDEGSFFVHMGLEGVTYEYVDGQAQFMPHMFHQDRNPSGTPNWRYGLHAPQLIFHPVALREIARDMYLDVSREFAENPLALHFRPIAWRFEDSNEERQVNDLRVVVQDVANEFMLRFVMGELDPRNDADWNTYVDAMERAGLRNLEDLRHEIYSRNS